MSSIVKQKVGKHVYLYESVSYRDENGRPRNKRKMIGKIDESTGQPIYKPEYVKRMAASGNNEAIIPLGPSFFTADDYLDASMKNFGCVYLFKKIAQKSGLLQALRESFPHMENEILSLASHLITNGEQFAYCEDCLRGTGIQLMENMTPRRINELLVSIKKDERDKFYRSWCSICAEEEYRALDITSASIYSETMNSAKSEKKKHLKPNSCILIGRRTCYPIFQTDYNINTVDGATLQTALSSCKKLAGNKPTTIVIEQDSFSRSDVSEILRGKRQVDYLIAVPLTVSFAMNQVRDEGNHIDTLSNTIICGGNTMRAATKICYWDNKHKVYTHIFWSPQKALRMREDLYAHIIKLKEYASTHPSECASDPKYSKYLNIKRLANGEFSVDIYEDVMSRELESAGWQVFISNYISNAKEAIEIYMDKDVIEKSLRLLENSLDSAKIKAESNENLQSEAFVRFVSLVLLFEIHNVMREKELYSKMTMKKLILTLSEIQIQETDSVRVLPPLTKEQRIIYAAFDIPETM